MLVCVYLRVRVRTVSSLLRIILPSPPLDTLRCSSPPSSRLGNHIRHPRRPPYLDKRDCESNTAIGCLKHWLAVSAQDLNTQRIQHKKQSDGFLCSNTNLFLDALAASKGHTERSSQKLKGRLVLHACDVRLRCPIGNETFRAGDSSQEGTYGLATTLCALLFPLRKFWISSRHSRVCVCKCVCVCV